MRALVKRIVAIYVDLAAAFLGYSFPQKYSWRWKFNVLFWRYEPETTHILAQELKPGMVFVDIGAHIGYFTRLASKKVGARGRVIAFEADTENLSLLKKNTAGFSNVVCVGEAIGESERRATFYHVRGSSGCHSLIPSENSGRSEVPVTTLDAFIEKNGIEHVDMIKMDIEGGEWKALDGMEKTLQTPNLKLVLEYNPGALTRAGIAPHDILRRLFAVGFSISLILPKKTPLSPAELGIIDRYLEAGSINIYCTKI